MTERLPSAPIAIVGSGLIGRAWAVAFVRAGWPVRLWDAQTAASEAARTWISDALQDLVSQELLEPEAAARAQVLVTRHDDLADALADVAYVQESAPETLEIKVALWRDLDQLAPPDAILASSTSAIVPSRFTEGLEGRHRCLVAHPINPPHLVPAVELVPAPWTAPETLERAAAVQTAIGQAPIMLEREIEAFVVNRLQNALLEEAFRLVDRGVCTTAAVDVALKEGLALRWSFMGPFETIDLNAPGGVRDYCERYHGIGAALFPTMQWRSDWRGTVLDTIERERRAALAAEALPDRTRWRDRRLMALLRHKRSAAREIGD